MKEISVKMPFRVVTVVLTFILLAAGAVYAAPINTDTFTISDLSGPLAGNTYTGSVTWDPSVSLNLISFNTDFPGWAGATLADLAYAPYFTPPAGIELFYAPPPVGNTNAFAFFGTSPFFSYGTTITVNGDFSDAGQGTVTWGSITGSTPEPGTWIMFGSGIIALAGTVRRKINLSLVCASS